MNDFLQNMQSLTLYKQLDKKKKENEKKDDLNDLEDDVRFEIIKYKNATMSKHSNAKINSTTYNDYSSISELSSHKINPTTNIKDTFAKENSLNNFTSKASETKGNISNTSNSNIVGSSSNLTGYSSAFSSAIGKTNIPSITQFGLIKMTGTEGNLQNGYTIGKDAKFRATASLEYVTRDENEKPISEIKDKNGNIISKVEAKEYMQTIHAERRLVLSPNPRLNLTEEQLDKVVRATMSSYSESFGKEFNYFYAIHNNTSTPHAHIIMTSNHPDGDGIKMYKDELFELKMNFEDNLKEVTKDYGINLKDVTTLPAAKQIANFIGAIPDTSIFNRNKFLAQKISKKFDLEFDSTHIGNNPQALENWFKNNDNLLKEYFMSATNKDAFLFQDYLNNAKDLSNKYDLGLNKETTTNINEFKIWLDNKQEIFLAERIAQDKNIFLKKEDVLNGNKLYKWFQENEKEIKEWNEVHKHFPSKQMSSLAQKYSEMIDNKPTNLLNDRKETRDFVRNYTRNPLLFAGDTRKALYSVLSIKKEQYKNETLENRITKSSSNNEIKRIESLQKRLALGQEISEGSLKRYNIDTKLFSIDSKEIKLDGINFSNADIKQNLVSKISSHIQQLNKDFEDNKIDTEHYKIYSKKATALNHVISKSNNVSISALENIGLDKEKDLKEFKIDKVNTELRIINFKNSDLNNNMQDIKDIEKNNINRPLNHQIHMLLEISNKLNIKIGNIENISYKETNKFIDEHKNFNSYNSKNIIKLIKNIQNENISLKSNDLFLNSYIESINKNLGNLQNKILTGKNISLNEIKSTGIDPKELEIYQGNLKIYVIANEKNNLKELEVLKNFSNEKEYRNFINDIENNKISKLNLNNSLANLISNNTNIKSLPLDLKSNLLSNIKFEVKETTIDMIKINSLENLLNNKAKINETISNAIFNSPKYFNSISNKLLVEHGIEIKTAKDLSNNFHKIGQENPVRIEFSNYLKEIKQSNNVLKNDDLYINNYIDNKNLKIDTLIEKLDSNKELDFESLKNIGIDSTKIEVYEKKYVATFINNNGDNLKKLEDLKNYFNSDEEKYEELLKDFKNGMLKNTNFNYALSNATNKKDILELPINLKPTFELIEKDDSHKMIKINSLGNLLNNKTEINETISNTIFNSPKYLNNISNKLLIEHGIEIKTAKDLSNNFHKIGKPSELRNLITKTIQYHINEFRESNDLNKENDFNKYIEEINSNKQSKIILDLKQKELYGLNGFLSKNNGLYPIFESDMNKIGANTIDFNDKSTVKIKVEVIPNNDENKPLLLNAFKLMIGSSTNKINNLEINEIDALAINELNKNIKSKSEFKEATNEYIKTSINPKQSINYVSTILDNRTLNNMSYLIESNTIKDIPKNFLEARNIDTNNFEIEEKDKDVNTISMSSKNNLDQFKEFILNNNLENILNTQNELSTIHTGNEINPNYKIEINSFISQNHEITNSNVNEFNTLLSFAIEDKNIKLIDSLYKLDIESKNDPELLELKFISYAETLNISKDDIYYKMINQYFNINENELNAIDNLETTFNTLFELSNASTERIQLTPDDIKHQLYIENLVELVSQEYEQYQWKYFDMDNENVSEDNMKAYFESTQDFRNEALKLNDLISEKLEIKELENQIKELLDNNNFKEAQELMQDERLEINTKNTFEFMHKNMLMNENILDEVYEKVIDNIKLEEKVYEIFKNDDDFINEMKKIDLEINMIDEINEELKQTELEEYELTLGGN